MARLARMNMLGTKIATNTPVLVAVLVFAIASLLPEAFTDRYGAVAFASRTPIAPVLAALSRAINALVVGVTILLLLRNYNHRPGHTGGTPFLSQFPIWLPYVFAWLMGVTLGAYPGTTGYSLISLLIVLAAASIRVEPSSPSFLLPLTAWTFRIIVFASLLVSLLWPERAFAPYEVWPGGWREGHDRLQGLLPHPNTLAWVAALAIAFELFARQQERKGRPSFLNVFFLAAGGLALFLTGSRTASISLLVGILSVALYRGFGKSNLFKYGVFTLGIPVSMLIIFGIVTTGFTLESFNGRLLTWKSAWEQFSDNIVAGTGPGAYLYEDERIAGYAHNQLLQTMSELGILGLVALVLHLYFLIALMRSSAANSLGVCAVVMWLVMFASENLLRFAAPSFVLQIVLFQMTLLVSIGERPRRSLNG